MTPFEAFYGRTPPKISSYISGYSNIAAIDNTLTSRGRLLRLLRENLNKAQLQMKSLANAHRLDQTFQEGDWVLLKLQPYRQTSLKHHQPFKLSRWFVGPFCVNRRIREVGYELDLPPTTKIYPVFHVSKLRPYYGTPYVEPLALPTSVKSTTV